MSSTKTSKGVSELVGLGEFNDVVTILHYSTHHKDNNRTEVNTSDSHSDVLLLCFL